MPGLWRKSWIKPTIKAVVGLLVVIAVARQAWRAWLDLSAHDPPLRFDPPWLVLAGGLYLLGLIAFGGFYARLLQHSATPITASRAIRAYVISHLGKYVPGKALVVVMRAGLSAAAGARPATAALATLFETLLMMSVGGIVAAIGFAVSPARTTRIEIGSWGAASVPLALVALTAAIGFLILVDRRIFARLSAVASLPFRDVGPDALPRLSGRLTLEGAFWDAAGWVLLGLSQVAVLRSMRPEGLPLSQWPLVIASVALATVAGFAVPIAPGGLGVREWALWTALGAAIDHDHAVVASLVLRLCWLAVEVFAGFFASITFRSPLPRVALEAQSREAD